MSIELVMSSNHLILCQPSFPPTLSLSWNQSLFQWLGSLPQVDKVLELQVQHQFSEYSGLISFRMDWFDPLAVQGTLKSLLQHHNLKASILWCSAFSMVQLSEYQLTANCLDPCPSPALRYLCLTCWDPHRHRSHSPAHYPQSSVLLMKGPQGSWELCRQALMSLTGRPAGT